MEKRLDLSRRHFLGASTGALIVAAGGRHARAQAMRDVTIALSSNSFSTVVTKFAGRRGLFAKHGLDARLVTMDNANAAFAALIGGSAEVASSGAGEALAALSRGRETIAVANIYRGLSSVIVLDKRVADKTSLTPESPIAERLKALDGVLLAAPNPTAIFGISIDLSVRSVGAELKMTYMGQGAMAAALESGAIQAYVAGTPYWVPPVSRGAAVVWIKPVAGELPDAFTPTSSGTLLMAKDFARANPALMESVRSVVDDVADFIRTDQEGAMAELAAIYPDLDGETIRLGFANEWQNWTRPVVTVEDVQHDIDFLKTAGQAFPGLDTIDPKALVTL
jgi:ABC-type nitrate/sulfonate/bicarbonate transport system substrate-binding protein